MSIFSDMIKNDMREIMADGLNLATLEKLQDKAGKYHKLLAAFLFLGGKKVVASEARDFHADLKSYGVLANAEKIITKLRALDQNKARQMAKEWFANQTPDKAMKAAKSLKDNIGIVPRADLITMASVMTGIMPPRAYDIILKPLNMTPTQIIDQQLENVRSHTIDELAQQSLTAAQFFPVDAAADAILAFSNSITVTDVQKIADYTADHFTMQDCELWAVSGACFTRDVLSAVSKHGNPVQIKGGEKENAAEFGAQTKRLLTVFEEAVHNAGFEKKVEKLAVAIHAAKDEGLRLAEKAGKSVGKPKRGSDSSGPGLC